MISSLATHWESDLAQSSCLVDVPSYLYLLDCQQIGLQLLVLVQVLRLGLEAVQRRWEQYLFQQQESLKQISYLAHLSEPVGLQKRQDFQVAWGQTKQMLQHLLHSQTGWIRQALVVHQWRLGTRNQDLFRLQVQMVWHYFGTILMESLAHQDFRMLPVHHSGVQRAKVLLDYRQAMEIRNSTKIHPLVMDSQEQLPQDSVPLPKQTEGSQFPLYLVQAQRQLLPC